MAEFNISIIKKGVEEALNETFKDGKSILQWAEIGMTTPQVVRCKDCVKRRTSKCALRQTGDQYLDLDPDDDWFCADGEVKQDE